jgi:tetratricopeptide (TPR) repeat protein
VAIDREKVQQAAQKLVEKKKYKEAVLEYQKITAADPNDARTLLKIGDLQSKLASHAEAVATYESVAKLYANQGFALKAIAVYKQIREIIAKYAPNLEERYSHVGPKLAELYQQLGLISDALAALDEVAVRLMAQGREREAVGTFRKIVELDPTNPLTHLRLGEALVRSNEVDEAIAEFENGCEQLEKLGRRDERIKVLERILAVQSSVARCKRLAQAYVDRGQREDGLRALSKLQPVFQQNQKDVETLKLLARAFELIGQAEKSLEVQKELARVARDANDQAQFVQATERLLHIAPNDDQVRRLAIQAGLLAEPAPPPPPKPAPQPMAAPPPPAAFAPPPARPAPQPLRPAAPVYEIEEEIEEIDDVDDAEIVEDDSDDNAPWSEERLAEALDRALADAESFRRVRLFDRAFEAVDVAISLAPYRIDIRELQRDVLLEASRIDDAVVVMLHIASMYSEVPDPESSARTLQDVLAFDPRNAHALQMLTDLGFEVVDEETEQAPLEQTETGGWNHGVGVGGLDPVAARSRENVHPDNGVTMPPPSKAPPVGPELSLEDALDEAEFFVTRGMLEDARAVLEEQYRRYPNNPLLRERLEELEATEQAGANQSSGTRERPSFDYSGSLDALESLQPEAQGYFGATGDIDVEQVFAKFKEGVAAQVSPEDSQAHYDLGLAYREMGLHDDSIREFGTAAHDPRMASVCYAMIGVVERDRGRLEEALSAFLQGIEAPHVDANQEAILSYEIGYLYEQAGIFAQSYEYYERAAAALPGFRDVDMRIMAVRDRLPKVAKR